MDQNKNILAYLKIMRQLSSNLNSMVIGRNGTEMAFVVIRSIPDQFGYISNALKALGS